MPDHDGIEVLAIARRRPEFADTPALMICAAAAATPAAEEGSNHRVAWLVQTVTTVAAAYDPGVAGGP